MKIRHIDLGEHRFISSDGGCDRPGFPPDVQKFGADMVYTEFVSADALIRSVGKPCKS